MMVLIVSQPWPYSVTWSRAANRSNAEAGRRLSKKPPRSFCLFGKQNKSDSPRSCTGGKRYRDAKATTFAAVIDGQERQVSTRIGQEEEIYPASVCPFNP